MAERATPPGGPRADARRPGELRHRLFVPALRRGGGAVPLVVVLHGCTQSAEDVAVGTRMDRLAEEHGFLVLYPEQAPGAHPQRCWSWYDPAHQGRGAGEPARIVQVVRRVMREHAVDAGRVYVAGVSAGGAMAAILAATYPELFAAVGIHSGIAYRLAESEAEALRAMREPPGAAAGAERLLESMGARARVVPLIAFQGDADDVVAPANLEVLVGQWSALAHAAGRALSERAEQGAAGGYGYRRRVWRAEDGDPVLEAWRVEGLGHAWSGGSPRGSYADPNGPDASAEMVRFFLAQPRPSPRAGPPGPGRDRVRNATFSRVEQ